MEQMAHGFPMYPLAFSFQVKVVGLLGAAQEFLESNFSASCSNPQNKAGNECSKWRMDVNQNICYFLDNAEFKCCCSCPQPGIWRMFITLEVYSQMVEKR